MSAVLEAAPPPTQAPDRWLNVADLLHQLGDIPAERVRLTPTPGTATLDDLIANNESEDRRICEWVDGTLVEKALMGWVESFAAANLLGYFFVYLQTHPTGILLGADGVLRILPNIGRAADVTFVSMAKFPGGVMPTHEKVPALVPDLAVEVLSEGNTKAEITRKRGEYFRAGVRLVWEIDPDPRTAKLYTAFDQSTEIDEAGVLDGGDVLPGFRLPLRNLFVPPGQVPG